MQNLMVGRREMLKLFASAGSALLLVDGRDHAIFGARMHPDAPSDSTRHLALLGRRLAEGQPRLARGLASHVERQIALDGGRTTFASRAAAARRFFLRPDRLRREFDRGAVVSVGGWILARSEAAVCAWAHSFLARETQIA